MQVIGLCRPHREPLIEAAHEAGQEGVPGVDAGHVLDAQFLHQPILQRRIGALDTALRLAGVRAEDLDVELRERTAELGHASTTLGVWPVHTEHGVLVRVEGNRAAMLLQVATKRLEVRGRALAGNEQQLHQLVGRIVDEDQQCARLAPLLEPAVLRAVDLYQLAVRLTPKPWLMERSSLLAGQPYAVSHHPAPQRLPAYMNRVPFLERFRGQRGTEVGVVGLDQLHSVLPNAWVKASVRLTIPGLVDQPEPALLLVPGQQTVCLPFTDAQHGSCCYHGASA